MTHDEDRQNLIDERAGIAEELASRNEDIEELNAEIVEQKMKLQCCLEAYDNLKQELEAEIKELKTTIVNYDKLHKILNKEIKELKEKLSVKTKKICPFMSAGSVVTACRTDCRMWIDLGSGGRVKSYCTIVKGLGFLQNIGMGE